MQTLPPKKIRENNHTKSLKKNLNPIKSMLVKELFTSSHNCCNKTNNKKLKTGFVLLIRYIFLFDLRIFEVGMMFSIRSIMIPWSLINAQMIYRDPFSISLQKTFMKNLNLDFVQIIYVLLT